MQRRALAAGLATVAGLVAASPASAAGKADMEVERVAAEGRTPSSARRDQTDMPYASVNASCAYASDA